MRQMVSNSWNGGKKILLMGETLIFTIPRLNFFVMLNAKNL